MGIRNIDYNKLIYNMLKFIALCICVICIGFIGQHLYNKYSTPVEENEIKATKSQPIPNQNDVLSEENDKLTKEFENEKEYIINLDDDNTLREFYRLLGK